MHRDQLAEMAQSSLEKRAYGSKWDTNEEDAPCGRVQNHPRTPLADKGGRRGAAESTIRLRNDSADSTGSQARNSAVGRGIVGKNCQVRVDVESKRGRRCSESRDLTSVASKICSAAFICTTTSIAT